VQSEDVNDEIEEGGDDVVVPRQRQSRDTGSLTNYGPQSTGVSSVYSEMSVRTSSYIMSDHVFRTPLHGGSVLIVAV